MQKARIHTALSAFALLCWAPVPAQAADPRTFVCDVLTAAELTDAGDLGANAYTRLLTEGAKIRFDEKSGRFVRELPTGDLPTRRFVVMQRGGEEQDLVARLIGTTGGAAAHDVFRIRVALPAMPFVYLEGTVVVTGICASG